MWFDVANGFKLFNLGGIIDFWINFGSTDPPSVEVFVYGKMSANELPSRGRVPDVLEECLPRVLTL